MVIGSTTCEQPSTHCFLESSGQVAYMKTHPYSMPTLTGVGDQQMVATSMGPFSSIMASDGH